MDDSEGNTGVSYEDYDIEINGFRQKKIGFRQKVTHTVSNRVSIGHYFISLRCGSREKTSLESCAAIGIYKFHTTTDRYKSGSNAIIFVNNDKEI